MQVEIPSACGGAAGWPEEVPAEHGLMPAASCQIRVPGQWALWVHHTWGLGGSQEVGLPGLLPDGALPWPLP